MTGLTEAKIAADTLIEGDVLKVDLDPKNKFDPYAVKLYKGDKFLGYVMTVHSRVFYKSSQLQVSVYKVEKDEYIKRVFIRIAMPQ